MNANRITDEAQVLRLTIHGRLVGYLVRLSNGYNSLRFADEFRNYTMRPTFSLITHPDFPRSDKLLAERWARTQQLPPVLSNLLPEGALREYMAQSLGVHVDNEFALLAYSGSDLPGAIVAEPLNPEDIPAGALSGYQYARPMAFATSQRGTKFSLAGVQMKFSMQRKEGRYRFNRDDELGDWIVKAPSTIHKQVPESEYTAMSLASQVGIEIPEIKLVGLDRLDELPDIALPDEQFAFAIKRFDRDGGKRIHMEDFAQILAKYPHEKYGNANYEQIGKIIYQYSGDGLADIQQFARRLLVNILLANGDAHLKNWSFLYSDTITPRFSPAYDIVTTQVYIEGEDSFALNLAGGKRWYEVTLQDFQRWAESTGAPWRAIEPHLKDVMEKARDLWPGTLHNLPMADHHKGQLRRHWGRLSADFRIA